MAVARLFAEDFMECKPIVSSLILAVGIAAGAALLGNQIGSGIEDLVSRDRVVTVKGLAEQVVKADRVTWPIGYRELGNDLQAVYAKIRIRQNQVVAFLKKAGLSDAEISVAAPTVTDAQADNYSNQPKAFRYNMVQTVTVSTDKVDLVLDLMKRQSELLQEGVALANDYSWQTTFEFTGLNSVKPAMIEQATKNARVSALKFAEDSGSTLGKIRRANQGQFSISNRDNFTPEVKNIRVVTTVEYYLKD